MSPLLLLYSLTPAPTLDCAQQTELCALFGESTQAFSQALWRLRTLGLTPSERAQAVSLLRRAHTPTPSAHKSRGQELELRAFHWELWGFQETLLVARSWWEREPELLTPAALAICLTLYTPQGSSRRCANEDYLAWSMPPGSRAQLSREDGAALSWPAPGS